MSMAFNVRCLSWGAVFYILGLPHDEAMLFISLGYGNTTDRTPFPSDTINDYIPLHCCNNERDGVSYHQPHDCLLNRLFRCRLKKTSKLRVTGLCVGNSPGTGEFPAQMSSSAENVSIWWQWQWQWQWNNLYCQGTYKSCTESYDENKTSNRTIIHEIYRTWQRGREAIMAYVPQYQLYQRDCVFGVQSRNSAECWNSFNLMLFLSSTCMSYLYLKKNTCAHTYTCVHIFIKI